MKKIGRFRFGGLENKIFNLCVILVVLAIMSFAVIGMFQLGELSDMSEKNNQTQSEYIKDYSRETMLSYTEGVMSESAYLQASNIESELWVILYDFKVIDKQIQAIFSHPERYKNIGLSDPDKKNEGKVVAQRMLPDRDKKISDESEEMLGRLANIAPTIEEMVAANDNVMLDYIVALPDGASMTVDTASGGKFDKDGMIKNYDPRVRPWYKGALDAKGLFVFNAEYDVLYDVPEVTFGWPVYVGDKAVAVLEQSIKLSTISEMLSHVSISEDGFSVLINESGQIIYSSAKEGELVMTKDLSSNALNTSSDDLKAVLKKAIGGEVGFESVRMEDGDHFVSYAPVPSVGWTMLMFFPDAEMMEATDGLLKKVDESTEETRALFEKKVKRTSWITLGVLITIILTAIVASILFARKLLRPINLMTKKVEGLSEDNLLFEFEDAYRTGDEIEVLARAFGDLSEKTVNYIKEVMQITAEREKIGAELSIATKIQSSSLPTNFSDFTSRGEFDVFASMDPAKAVGGDFYDMYFIDDDHLAVTVADVSDKGVPAALFMMISKTLLKVRAQRGGTPAEILTDVNAWLAENNKARMFVTVFLAILTISDGSILVGNAGHEYPTVCPAGADFMFVRGHHGFVLGAKKGMKYQNIEFKANPGDTFFLYTDGVPEATNAEGEQFGEDRMIETLNRHKEDKPEELLKHVREDIDAFVGDAPQFDDLTMLSLKYYG